MNFAKLLSQNLKLLLLAVGQLVAPERLAKFRSRFEPNVEVSVLKVQSVQLEERHVSVILHVVRVGECQPVHLLVGEVKARKSLLRFRACRLPFDVVFEAQLNAVVVKGVRNVVSLRGEIEK